MITAHALVNQQPHIDFCIDDLDKRLESVEKNVDFGYCLQHKHFNLNDKEVLLYKFLENQIDCEVALYEDDMFPCVFYSNGREYVPVGFTRQKECSLLVPDIHYPHVGICSMSFSYTKNLLEKTNENDRLQWMVCDEINFDDAMSTMVFPSSINECRSWCEGKNNDHDRMHTGP